MRSTAAPGEEDHPAAGGSQATFRPLEVFTVAAALYFAVLFPTSLATRQLERRLAVSGESTAR